MNFLQHSVKKYEFVSLEELVCDVVEMFNNPENQIQDIALILTSEEITDYLTAFVSTDKFRPVGIDWLDNDDQTYILLLCRGDSKDLMFVQPLEDYNFAWLKSGGLCVSASVEESVFDKLLEKNPDVILFDIDE